MSVNIGINANPAQAVAAMDSLRDALRRTNQEAKSFRDLDLSHPELASFAQDLGQMQRQLEDLMRISRGATAGAARRVFGAAPGGANPLNWDVHDADWARMYPDEAERRRFQSRVQDYVTRGTSFAPAPPAPPTPPAPPPAAGNGGGGGGGPQYSNEAEDAANALPSQVTFLGTTVATPRVLARAAAQAATFGLGLAGIGGIRSALSSSYHLATDENNANERLYRGLPDLSTSFDDLKRSIREVADASGITYREAQTLGATFQRVTGNMEAAGGFRRDGVDNIAAWTKLSAGMARGWGTDIQTTGGLMARAANHMDGERFAMMVGDAAARGMQGGDMLSAMQSIVQYQERTSRLLVAASPDQAASFAGMWAGMNATNRPGLRGENASALIGTMDNAVRNGMQAGGAVTATHFRAFAAHGVNDPMQMQYLAEGGMFQKLPDGTTVYDALRGEVDRQYGRSSAMRLPRLFAMSSLFGGTMHQQEAMDGVKPENVNATLETLQRYHLDPNKVSRTAFASIAQTLATGQFTRMRDRLLERSDISDDEKSGLRDARGDGLRERVIRMLAQHGADGTDATRNQNASAALENRMADFGSAVLVKPMTVLKEGITNLADVIKGLTNALTHGQSGGSSGPLPYLGGSVPDSGITNIAYRARMTAGGGIQLPGGSGGDGGQASAAGALTPEQRQAILSSATTGTMVPPALLDALITQESGWRADARRLGGTDTGLGQITDSTAADPGFGMEPISRQDRLDPARNARWTARYLEARGRALGLTRREDWSNPDKVSRALGAFNGGGDPGYAGHVLRHMRAPQSVRPAAPDPQQIQASIEPLVVIHQDSRGNHLREERLRVRPIGPAQVWGLA